MQNILVIDTTKSGVVKVELKKGTEKVTQESEQKFGSQVLLPLINQVLEEGELTFADLHAISVSTGPGSFTGIRVGVAVANALALALKIPVNGKKVETNLIYE